MITKVLVNGSEVSFPDAKPFIDERGRTQAPARFVAQELGARVNWNQETNTAYISGHGKLIAITPGQETAIVNGETVLLSSSAVLVQDRIFVPVRFVVETLGAAVNWDQDRQAVNISMDLPIINDFAISFTKEESGWYTVPRTFTAWVAAKNTKKVDFYLAPTGTGRVPVKIATADGSNGHFSITYRLPEESTLAHFWAVALNDKGEESTQILNVYREGGPEPPASIDGIPLHPSFFWSDEQDGAAREALGRWLGPDYEKSSHKVILSSWVQKPSCKEIVRWYQDELEKLGWKVLSLSGGSTNWCMSAEKDGRLLEVHYAWGSGDNGTEPPSDPEKGYRMVVVVKNPLNLPSREILNLENLSMTGYNRDLHFAPGGEKAVFSGYSYDKSGESNSSLIMVDFSKGTAALLDEGKFMRTLGLDARGDDVLYMKDGSLWLMSLKDGGKVKIADDTYFGAFSPDGWKIAYVQQGAGLWVCDKNGGDKKRLTSTSDDWYPVWYPDAKCIFFFNDLGRELGDGAGHLQGIARISVADGSVESILPDKTGKFRSARWIVPGSSLHVVSGWDDGRFEHIVDLAGNRIIDLGENFNNNKFTAAIDSAGGRLLKVSTGGIIEIYDAAGKLVKSFDLGLDDNYYYSAAVTPDGHNALFMRGRRSGGNGPEAVKIDVFNTENGSFRSIGDGSANYESCFWSPGDGQVLILEKKIIDNEYRLSGFRKVDIGSSEDQKQGESDIFTPVQESDLSSEENVFIEEVKMTKGVHRRGDLYVVALGECSSAGYGIEFVKNEMSWEQAKVYVRLTKPEPGKMYAAVITYPYLAGRVNLLPHTTISFIDIETGEFL